MLYSFTGESDGGVPLAGVVRDGAGNLYGTAARGGSAAAGVVYKVDPSGNETVLHNFSGAPDGSEPQAALILDTQGNLYGTTALGGQSKLGTVFKVDPSGNETVLYSFSSVLDGTLPNSLTLDTAGNLYGTAYSGGGFRNGGGAGCGNVFKIDPAGNLTVLYNFMCVSDGDNPAGPVVFDSAGNLYGTTLGGGAHGFGTVFKLDPSGNEAVLHSFAGQPDGDGPRGALIFDASGNLYGTTQSGGTAGLGMIFTISASGQERTFYFFPASASGQSSTAGLTLDSAGNLYGTTQYGGAFNGGVVFEIAPNGQETVLHAFTGGADGANPATGVVLDHAGNLYGTTNGGGAHGFGVVYKLDTSGAETVLYSFTGGADGGTPNGVILDAAGNLFGTTYQGGGGQCESSHCGVVFKVDATGKETVLHNFSPGDGGNPLAGVVRDASGNLYGTTTSGGPANAGSVYKLDPAGRETVLHSFMGADDGRDPRGGVVFDAAGNLYGTTVADGAAGCGTVFKVDPSGDETILYSFLTSGSGDGCNPYAGVTLGAAGILYGTTEGGGSGSGTVYKVEPSGNETVLFTFGGDAGIYPYAGVILDSAGNLYGTTNSGGSWETGVIFKLEP